MPFLRHNAIQQVQSRDGVSIQIPSEKISDYFGINSFGIEEMKATLSPETFSRIEYAINKGKKIDEETADSVATAVKTWAIPKGITHYTHWFQPLTGTTAEKHDTFFDSSSKIEKFKGSALAQQEPDASSFPSGGIRSTFEARGYTAWDPSSPMFIFGDTLCIPTIFVSYTGEALDFKAPLLKTTEALDRAATNVCKLFDRNITKVHVSLGCEQEYFVVDKALYNARPDLVMCGRTVFGHSPARGQQLDDHYFGSIAPRIQNFMKDFEIEALKLGIPVRTRHNEVAPSQFEVAPLYEEINKAIDNNQLLMDLMGKVAERHELKVLFHEKPFAELNGNGKHCNWSLITNTDVNLMAPTSNARDNLLFLTFLVNVIKAVNDNADILRASVASAGNDYRMGANEAPPSIISIFVGKQLTAVLNELEQKGNVKVKKGDNMYMKLGIDKIPEIILDNTDRNRTSPFAFTGNKFEFRAVGGSSNVAQPMTILNLIMVDQLRKFKKDIEKLMDQGTERRMAIVNVLRDYITQAKGILFDGDNYSEGWLKEAKKRKLNNIRDTARALDAYISKSAKSLYKRNNIASERELEARHEIILKNYIMKIQIESRVMGDLVLNHILPTAFAYQNKLIKNAQGLQGLGIENQSVVSTLKEISKHIEIIKTSVNGMIEERKKANAIQNTREQAIAYCDQVKERFFDKIRYSVDKLELLVDDDDWPLVKYRELLFLR